MKWLPFGFAHLFRHEWYIWHESELLEKMQERRCRACNLRQVRPLIVPHVHTWGKWTPYGEISHEGRTQGMVQYRACAECHFIEFDYQTMYTPYARRPE